MIYAGHGRISPCAIEEKVHIDRRSGGSCAQGPVITGAILNAGAIDVERIAVVFIIGESPDVILRGIIRIDADGAHAARPVGVIHLIVIRRGDGI